MHTPPPDESQEKNVSPEQSRHAMPPKKPCPSEDRGILPPSQAPSDEPDAIPDPDSIDISALSPLAALKLLTVTVDRLVRLSAEAPLTPPSSNPNTPRLQVHAEHVSETQGNSNQAAEHSPDHNSPNYHHHHDVPHPHKTPIGSPEAHPTEPHDVSQPTSNFSIDSVSDPDDGLQAQYRMLAKKFNSRIPPPIPLEVYLKRLHTYCPLSTAVYLAAGEYILRLSGNSLTYLESTTRERSPGDEMPLPAYVVPVTSKTVHRMLLATLRVAAKALEDRTFPHARVSKVGGVSEKELARLEISCAFLLDFELLVKPWVMQRIAKRMAVCWEEEHNRQE